MLLGPKDFGPWEVTVSEDRWLQQARERLEGEGFIVLTPVEASELVRKNTALGQQIALLDREGPKLLDDAHKDASNAWERAVQEQDRRIVAEVERNSWRDQYDNSEELRIKEKGYLVAQIVALREALVPLLTEPVVASDVEKARKVWEETEQAQ